jgi:hypothetical protein
MFSDKMEIILPAVLRSRQQFSEVLFSFFSHAPCSLLYGALSRDGRLVFFDETTIFAAAFTECIGRLYRSCL